MYTSYFYHILLITVVIGIQSIQTAESPRLDERPGNGNIHMIIKRELTNYCGLSFQRAHTHTHSHTRTGTRSDRCNTYACHTGPHIQHTCYFACHGLHTKSYTYMHIYIYIYKHCCLLIFIGIVIVILVIRSPSAPTCRSRARAQLLLLLVLVSLSLLLLVLLLLLLQY